MSAIASISTAAVAQPAASGAMRTLPSGEWVEARLAGTAERPIALWLLTPPRGSELRVCVAAEFPVSALLLIGRDLAPGENPVSTLPGTTTHAVEGIQVLIANSGVHDSLFVLVLKAKSDTNLTYRLRGTWRGMVAGMPEAVGLLEHGASRHGQFAGCRIDEGMRGMMRGESWAFLAAAGDSLLVDAVSTDMDVDVEVYDPAGRRILRETERGDAHVALRQLAPGLHRVEVRPASRTNNRLTGAYTLTVR